MMIIIRPDCDYVNRSLNVQLAAEEDLITRCVLNDKAVIIVPRVISLVRLCVRWYFGVMSYHTSSTLIPDLACPSISCPTLICPVLPWHIGM